MKQRLSEFRRKPETAYLRMVRDLPDGPDLFDPRLVARAVLRQRSV